jgi:hypothetical protein
LLFDGFIHRGQMLLRDAPHPVEIIHSGRVINRDTLRQIRMVKHFTPRPQPGRQ